MKKISIILGTFFLFLIKGYASPLSILNNPYQYSGQYRDSESHLDYLNARYYDSDTMRFTSRDSYDLLNLYAYADGNPIMNEDPTGHFSWNDFKNGTLDVLTAGGYSANNPILMTCGIILSTAIIIGGGAITYSLLARSRATQILAPITVDNFAEVGAKNVINNIISIDPKLSMAFDTLSKFSPRFVREEVANGIAYGPQIIESPFTNIKKEQFERAGLEGIMDLLEKEGGLGKNYENVAPSYKDAVREVTSRYGRGSTFKGGEYFKDIDEHIQKSRGMELDKRLIEPDLQMSSLMMWAHWLSI